MFDREFFEKSFHEQGSEMGAGLIRGSALLTDGTLLKIRRIAAAADAYVWLEVFPAGGMTEEERKKRTDKLKDRVVFDRIAVPYESIVRCEMTVTDPEPDEDQIMGFHTIV